MTLVRSSASSFQRSSKVSSGLTWSMSGSITYLSTNPRRSTSGRSHISRMISSKTLKWAALESHLISSRHGGGGGVRRNFDRPYWIPLPTAAVTAERPFPINKAFVSLTLKASVVAQLGRRWVHRRKVKADLRTDFGAKSAEEGHYCGRSSNESWW